MRLLRRLGRQVLPLVVLAVLVTAGLALYHGEREGRQRSYTAGAADSPDRLDILVTIERLDPANQRLTVQLTPVARDTPTSDPEPLIPARTLTVETTSPTKSAIQYPAGQRATATELTVNAAGITSDYPFDRYTAYIGLYAHADGDTLPVSLSLDDNDPSFALVVTQEHSPSGSVFLDMTLSRSRSTLIFTWLMMAVMWALALAVAAAARVQVTQRRGLTWPALGWMAATLFALTAFRNAAPGGPPVGSVLDYAAYLWAELIVAVSLVVTTVAAIRVERQDLERQDIPRQALASTARRSSAVVTGTRQVKSWQTYAAGAPSTRPRPSSSGMSAATPSPSASTAPGGAACSAVRCSSAVRGSSAGPTIAISAGPAISASAAARPAPAARGNRATMAGSTPSASLAAIRYSDEPVSAA
jgi:uncharacterized protein DUF4436